MKIVSILVLLFLLSAFAIGVGLQDSDSEIIDSSIDNASLVIENISFDYPTLEDVPNSKGIFKIVESGVKFVGVLGIETMRTGIYFGKDNPGYFTPEFILKIIKLIVVLVIVSLLIKPTFYVLVFIVMGLIWIIDYIKRKKFTNTKTGEQE